MQVNEEVKLLIDCCLALSKITELSETQKEFLKKQGVQIPEKEPK